MLIVGLFLLGGQYIDLGVVQGAPADPQPCNPSGGTYASVASIIHSYNVGAVKAPFQVCHSRSASGHGNLADQGESPMLPQCTNTGFIFSR